MSGEVAPGQSLMTMTFLYPQQPLFNPAETYPLHQDLPGMISMIKSTQLHTHVTKTCFISRGVFVTSTIILWLYDYQCKFFPMFSTFSMVIQLSFFFNYSICYIYISICPTFGAVTKLAKSTTYTGIILCTRPANERWHYIVTSSSIGWVHTQNDPLHIHIFCRIKNTSNISHVINCATDTL